MSTVATQINLEGGCDFEECVRFAWPLYRQLTEGNYDVMSVMAIPECTDAWRADHRTARKRAMRCFGRGYRSVFVRPELRGDELHAINVSMPERQGRPMSSAYREVPHYTEDPVYPCFRHGVHRYGIEDERGELVAYAWIYRSGDLALISTILGHGRHLENHVMYALFEAVVAYESADSDGFIVYNRHDSGGDGLRFFKERVGLSETLVEWKS